VKTLTISISNEKYNKFGLKNGNLKYTDFKNLVVNELFRTQLVKCVKSAQKCGLSSMTMNEINEEVRTVRRSICAL